MKNTARFFREKIMLIEQSGGNRPFSGMDFSDLWDIGFEV